MNRKIYTILAGMLCAFATVNAQSLIPTQESLSEIKGERREPRHGFTENKGQLHDQFGKANPDVKYLLNMTRLNVQLRATGFSYDAWIKDKGDHLKFHRVDINLVGANPNAVIIAEQPLSETVNIFNEQGAFTDIRSYQKVSYQNIYPGIDLEFIARVGKDKPVEYNFIVHPGADPAQIRLQYSNGGEISLRTNKIEMHLAFGSLKENIPASFTRQDGRSLNVQYNALDETTNLYAFHIPSYDKSQTLVIDPTPTLQWATYYGGVGNETIGASDADASGNVYVTGYTSSTTDIATMGAFQNTYGGGANDAFVMKFDAAGQRLWSTYIGGLADDQANSVRTDGSFVYVCGSTNSNEGIAFNGHQSTIAGIRDAFLVKLNAADGARIWGTYYGATASDVFSSVDITPDGGIVAGGTAGLGGTGIATPGAYQTAGGAFINGMIAKFTSTGVRLWGTYFRPATGATNVSQLRVAADASGIYFAGHQNGGGNLASPGSFQPAPQGGFDMYVGKLTNDGSTRLWCTYLGGPGVEQFADIKLDHTGNVLLLGSTSNFGLGTSGAYQSNTTSSSAILTKFAPDGARLWSTYYGAGFGGGIDVDENNNILLIGTDAGAGTNLSGACAYQANFGGGAEDVAIAKFTADGSTRLWATYLGSAADENGRSINYIGNGIFTVTGRTINGGGLATPGAFRSVTDGADGILARFSEQAIIPSDITATASSLSPTSQTICILGIPGVITGNTISYSTASYFTSPVYYQWQTSNSASGPWIDIAGEIFKDLQPASSQTNRYYRRLVQVRSTGCDKATIDSSAVAVVIVNSNLAPIANADGLQWYVCGAPNNTVTLNGSATGGNAPYTYQWFAGNGTAPVSNLASFTPASATSTTYTLKVTDASGCTDMDQAVVVPAIANAGADKSICQGSSGVQIGTAPVATPNVTYSWTLANGTPATTLSCTNCAQPIASPAIATSYVLTMTVNRKNNSTCSSTDTVTVTPVTAPNGTLAFAGTDKTICRGTTTVLGGTNDPTFTYNWAPGQYLSNSIVSNPTFNPGTIPVNCSKVYQATATKNGCSFTDDVKVTVVNSGITYEGENKCGPLWIGQAGGSNCVGATYSWSVVNGTGTILQTANDSASAYLFTPSGTTTFRRTTTVNGIACSADVQVSACGTGPVCDFNIVTLSSQKCPKVFGPGGSFTLGTTASASSYNFSWTPANLVSNPTAATVTVTSAVNATLTCTITNKYDSTITCSKSIEINDPAWAIPAYAFPDKNICGSTATSIGIPPVGGIQFAWSPTDGLDDDSTSNPMATLTNNRNYIVTAIETASGCSSSDTMTVHVANVTADAGMDRAVCNGATVLLGTPPPPGTNYTYSWQPIGAAYQNGTDANDAQPQVLFASASQIFTVTVTDPVSGCTATDDITLSGTLTSGTYAGSIDTACPGELIQLGQPAQALATYIWTMADGSAATGLSCSTCAGPTLTTPDVTSTYKVQVSYPGCSLPMEDTVRIVVKAAPAIALINQNYCPSSPVNIGFGSAGNPASPLNVAAYQWTPASGLSSATVANPTTNATAPIVYVVTVTYNNGCQRKDSVQVTPNVTADAGADKTICPGGTVGLGTASVTGVTYNWSGGPFSGSSTVAQPTAQPAATTTYAVSATANGCTAIDSVTVNVSTPPDFTLTGNTTICEGGTATVGLTTPAAVGSNWQWTPATGVTNATNPNTTIAATDTQAYRLTQTIIATGCSNYKEIVVVVNPNPINASASDTSICSGSTVNLPLNVTSAGSYQYVWTPSTGLSDPYTANPAVTTGFGQAYSVTITDNVSQCQRVATVNVAIKPEIECYPPVTLSGNIFHDANGIRDLTVNSTSAAPLPTGLYVTLVDSGNNMVNTVPVGASGSFNFGVVPVGQYRIVLHQTGTGSLVPNLPAGWLFMGENLGAGTGSDSAQTGILIDVSVLASNVINANFGIQQPPVSDPKTYTIDIPATNQFISLDGTHVSTGPGTSSPGQMTGSDPEEGILNGADSNRTVIITAAPNYGELWYNGQQLMAGEKIINYDPSLMSLKITDTTNNTVSFQYAYLDGANVQSVPVLYTLNWSTPLPVTLVDFKAIKSGDKALLSWETAMERQTDYFVVERSLDSKSWQPIARVAAAGNSSNGHQYEQYDTEPEDGLNYYRLKAVSLDGRHEYSMICRLSFGVMARLIKVVPNPASKSAVILLGNAVKTPTEIMLQNMSGQTVRRFKIPAGSKQHPMDLNGLAQGMYTISIETPGSVQNIKLVIE